MLITVVYNRVEALSYGKAEEVLADDDTVRMAQIVAKTLATAGHKVQLFDLNQESLKQLKTFTTDVFFNLAGGIDGLPHSEGLAAAALFKTGKPVIGSTKAALDLTTDKVATKKILQSHNLPTPGYLVVPNHGVDLSGLKFPVILKPVAEDCSLGISQDSVFSSPSGVGKKVQELLELYKEPVLVEEFIDGRELRVSLVGNGKNCLVLPISELIFGKTFNSKFKIFDFSAKWLPDTSSYEDTFAKSPAKLSKKLQTYVEEISLSAYLLTGCTDYGRVDIRLDKNNQPFILEVNANPAIGPDDALATSAAAAGIGYSELLEKIISGHENSHHL